MNQSGESDATLSRSSPLLQRTLAIVSTGVVTILLALVVVFVWPTRYRYVVMRTANNSLTMRIDRFSDRTWVLTPAGWISSQRRERPNPLPSIVGVGGRCSLLDVEISCDIGNETDYELRTVTIDLAVDKTAPNPATHTCIADLSGDIDPHTMGPMSVKPPCGYALIPDKWAWKIIAATGIKTYTPIPSPSDQLKAILDAASTDNATRHLAWDQFLAATDATDFKRRFDPIPLSTDVKASLWVLKFG